MSTLPPPPIAADIDLRDVPMPREVLIRIIMADLHLSERDAEQMVQAFFANGPQ